MGIQVANLHISSKSKLVGKAVGRISSRQDAHHSGTFRVKASASFNPPVYDYPNGTVALTVDLTDAVKGTFKSTSIEQINSFGKDTPTIVITGKCALGPVHMSKPPKGCRFWLLVANNRAAQDTKGTPDVVSFVVFDRGGVRVAYGTAPIVSGDFETSDGAD